MPSAHLGCEEPHALVAGSCAKYLHISGSRSCERSSPRTPYPAPALAKGRPRPRAAQSPYVRAQLRVGHLAAGCCRRGSGHSTGHNNMTLLHITIIAPTLMTRSGVCVVYRRAATSAGCPKSRAGGVRQHGSPVSDCVLRPGASLTPCRPRPSPVRLVRVPSGAVSRALLHGLWLGRGSDATRSGVCKAVLCPCTHVHLRL